jgi:hypothetical protein
MIRAVALHRLSARLAAVVLFAALFSAIPFHTAFAQTGSLAGSGWIQGFSVLGGPAVTCTDFNITGDVGVNLGGTFTQNNCTINGTIHAGDTAAGTAYSGFSEMYNLYATAGGACGVGKTGKSLGGETLSPEIYCFDAAADLGGTLTLDAGGDAGAVWIFVIGTSGTGALEATNFNVEMINGGQAGNVYWWVAEGATLTDSNFRGILLAGLDITINRGAFIGDALALGSVALTGVPSATLVSIAVTPDTIEIDAGTEQQFTATGAYSDGTSKVITTEVTWTTSSPEVASISPDGVATGLAAGTSTITATYGGTSGTAALTVTATTPATLVSIAVQPNPVTIVAGTDQQFTATAIYSDGTSEVITTGVTWTTSSPSVASVIRKKGIAKGHTAGTTTITATYGTLSAGATVTVTKDKKGKKD